MISHQCTQISFPVTTGFHMYESTEAFGGLQQGQTWLAYKYIDKRNLTNMK
jgi:hypothetical protein